MKKFKARNLKSKALVVLLMISMISVTGTFAYWAAGLTVDNTPEANVTVDVGTAEGVVSTITLSEVSDGILVPAGRAITGQVESVTVTIPVTWTELVGSNGQFNNTFDGNVGTITAVVSNIQIGGATTYSGLVVVTPTTPGTVLLDGTATDVIFTVTLTEPANVTAYTAIAGTDITFDITFTVTPTPVTP